MTQTRPEAATALPVLEEVRIGAPAHGGHAVARHEGRVIFVRHAAPGELVDVALTRAGSRDKFWRGEAVRNRAAPPDRVPHVWPEAGPGGIGGAELGHLSLEAQRRWKEAVIADTLRRIGHIEREVAVLPVPGESDGLGTRTRVELTVGEDGRPGMFRYRSHEIVPIRTMPLAVPGLMEHKALGRRWAPGTRLDLVAPSDGEHLVLANGEPVRGTRSTVRERVSVGDREYSYRLAGTGFWQVHRGAAHLLAARVIEAAQVAQNDTVLDLYAGSGLFTLPLADETGPGGVVHAVEGDADAVRHARRNAHEREHIRLHEGEVAAVLAGAAGSATPESGAGSGAAGTRLPERADVIVLDPPRAGAGREVVEQITRRAPRRIVHIACDPAALARDLRLFLDAGFEIESLDGFDLFPHTHHIEAVAVLVPAR